MKFLDKINALKETRQGLVEIKQTSKEVAQTSASALTTMHSSLSALKATKSYPRTFVLNEGNTFGKQVRVIIMLDISSSVAGTERDIYEGIKELVINHRNDKILMTLVTFNENTKIIYKDQPILTVEPNIIYPNGSTNLNGAIYQTVSQFFEASDTINLFITITDGEDNIREVSKKRVLSLIKEVENDSNLFYFLGEAMRETDIPYVRKMATDLGFNSNHIEVFTRMANGNKINFQVISKMLDDLLKKGTISSGWSEPIRSNLLMLTNGKRR